MKPLSSKQKERAYRWLVHGRARTLVKPLYHALLSAELAGHRIVDGWRALREKRDFSDVTAIIKTFERPERCEALVQSIRRHYPGLHIIVVDDSRQPRQIPGVETHLLPYDSGVSAGRSHAIAQVKTVYLVNMDDDHVVYRSTGLPAALEIMRSNPEIDIMGGKVIDLPLYISHDLKDAPLFPTLPSSKMPPGAKVAGLPVYDKVHSFFIGRTESVRSINWDPTLKRLDHADFFTRCKGRLVSVYNSDMRLLHVRDPFDDAYLSKRLDVEQDLAYLKRKYAQPWGAPDFPQPGTEV